MATFKNYFSKETNSSEAPMQHVEEKLSGGSSSGSRQNDILALLRMNCLSSPYIKKQVSTDMSPHANKTLIVKERMQQLQRSVSDLHVKHTTYIKEAGVKVQESVVGMHNKHTTYLKDRASSLQEGVKGNFVALRRALTTSRSERSTTLDEPELEPDFEQRSVVVRKLRMARNSIGNRWTLVRDRIGQITADPQVRAAAKPAACGAVVFGATGGTTGLITGGAVGAACGLPLAIFTFGTSIVAGAAIGGGAGLCAGAGVGGAVGLVGGGTYGYRQYSNEPAKAK